jgi:hypothetical protein
VSLAALIVLVLAALGASLFSSAPDPAPKPAPGPQEPPPDPAPASPPPLSPSPSASEKPPLRGGALSGIVRFENGTPAGGATVEVVFSGSRNPVGIESVSDENGRFAISGIEPRRGYRLRAVGRTSDGVELYPVHTRSLRAGGQEVEVRARAAGFLAGVIVSEEGAPLAGITVDALLSSSGRGGVTGETDKEGAFTLRVDRAKEYILRARIDSTPDRGYTWAWQCMYRVVPDRDDLRIVMKKGLEIRGEIISRTGDSVAGIPLLARCTRATLVEPPSARTDERGGFAIGGLPPGDWYIDLAAEALSRKARALIGDNPVKAGRTDVVLELVRAGTLEGQLLRPSGKPAVLWWIQLCHETLNVRRNATTKRDGTFLLRRVPAGTWRVECRCRTSDAHRRRFVMLDCGRITTGYEGTILRMPEPR